MIHLLASIPNGLILEDMGLLDDLWIEWAKPVRGVVTAPETPGHGLKIRSDFMQEYRVT